VIGVGLTLQPDEEYLELVAPLLPSVDYFEIAPETTWWEAPAAAAAGPDAPLPPLLPNGYHRRFAALGQRLGKAFVGHGVGLSLGTASRADAPRRRRWLARLRADQAVFGFRWYTDHLGASSLAGQAVGLPLPLPHSAYAAALVGRRLRALQAIVPAVGVENTAQYFLLGDPLAEPAFLARALRGAGTHLLLDLHNLYTTAENLGFSTTEYLAQLERHAVLDRVIELHLSGGSYSDGSWLPGARVLRLDSHDAAVPEPVWRLLTDVLPRCPRLRGVTLERMEGTVSAGDVAALADELSRIRAALARS
jgi:uncharacterized protein (UPF0276 family)